MCASTQRLHIICTLPHQVPLHTSHAPQPPTGDIGVQVCGQLCPVSIWGMYCMMNYGMCIKVLCHLCVLPNLSSLFPLFDVKAWLRRHLKNDNITNKNLCCWYVQHFMYKCIVLREVRTRDQIKHMHVCMSPMFFQLMCSLFKFLTCTGLAFRTDFTASCLHCFTSLT